MTLAVECDIKQQINKLSGISDTVSHFMPNIQGTYFSCGPLEKSLYFVEIFLFSLNASHSLYLKKYERGRSSALVTHLPSTSEIRDRKLPHLMWESS